VATVYEREEVKQYQFHGVGSTSQEDFLFFDFVMVILSRGWPGFLRQISCKLRAGAKPLGL